MLDKTSPNLQRFCTKGKRGRHLVGTPGTPSCDSEMVHAGLVGHVFRYNTSSNCPLWKEVEADVDRARTG